MNTFLISFSGAVIGSIVGIILVGKYYSWRDTRAHKKWEKAQEKALQKPKKQKGIDPKQTGKRSKR